MIIIIVIIIIIIITDTLREDLRTFMTLPCSVFLGTS